MNNSAARVEEVAGSAPDFIAALDLAGLPTADLSDAGRRFFRFHDANGTIGFIGWEVAGGAVLLRSMVVLPERRGQGWSRVMIGWTLNRLRADGVDEAYALTTSIAELARKMGFEAIERAAVPAGVQESKQFATLCPASAVVLRLRLT